MILTGKVDFRSIFKDYPIDLPKNSQNPSKIVKNPSNFAENRNFWAISRDVKTPKLALLSNGKFPVFGVLSYSGL